MCAGTIDDCRIGVGHLLLCTMYGPPFDSCCQKKQAVLHVLVPWGYSAVKYSSEVRAVYWDVVQEKKS